MTDDVCGSIRLNFYDGAGVRKQVSLREAKGIRFSEELNADGGATYSASLLAQALQTAPDLLEDGICKAALVLTPGQPPVEVFAWELVPTSGTLIGKQNEREVQCSAPGLTHLLSYAPVPPEVPGYDSNTEDARTFGWMSAQDPLWYVAGDWVQPTVLRAMGSEGLGLGADWITANPTPAIGDIALFRTEFTLAQAGPVRIWYSGVDTIQLFLDSELIASQYPSPVGMQSVDLMLSAGTHTLGAEVEQLNTGEHKLGLAVVDLTTNTVIRRSQSGNWRCHLVSGNRPGYTAAGIFLKLFAEAQADGVYGMSLLTPDFTATHDSAGVAWPDLQARAFPIAQTSLLDVVAELEQDAFDLRIKADGTIQAFVNQGSSKPNVVLQSSNITRMTYEGAAVRATRALIRSLQGWSEVVNTAGQTTYGRRYAGITSGVSVNKAQASRVATSLLESWARPTYVYTAVIRAVPGAVPFLDFVVGDVITAPVRGGGVSLLRVLSIAPSSPADAPGPVTFSVEMAAA